MRNARTHQKHGRRALAAAALAAVCCSGWGCHQHHYYYGSSGAGPCPPGVAMGTVLPSDVAVGPVCEVPDTVVVDSPVAGARSTLVDDGRAKPRVVVSEPSRRPSRFGWRSTNPEDVPAFTQIEGAVNSTVR